ncbi:hypothetical protein CLAFUW4_06639 [Fulvia fulva]|uniref:Uncharacterized protein n=1 Tax=Passalora fulva TaxID=5499 RepID=A0A9Q8UQB1_PASFU|nr:uncharacterized protein CLAFUR5_06784 [Fulvia fulva]KAK4621395.1 hypothetical protein CLAFUR4_06647 [Fulvia fulva]KAK4623479.1 hypothetical protein CLAFUR0_06641 [Fulvia fulva]UJO18611.1 hypothetical protein CLAFUR5_06784 [Fulvia fulva]WPV16157.1 hypothetical protein CLAFUW4_06639 [Fulvia fulva]WPV31572.1 hypothetical protein CLAFUW7_06638 [Fulvia fulva]
MPPKNLLLCFDIFGTLFKPLAKVLRLSGFSSRDIGRSFKEAFNTFAPLLGENDTRVLIAVITNSDDRKPDKRIFTTAEERKVYVSDKYDKDVVGTLENTFKTSKAISFGSLEKLAK